MVRIRFCNIAELGKGKDEHLYSKEKNQLEVTGGHSEDVMGDVTMWVGWLTWTERLSMSKTKNFYCV